jgi:hypothetical protein
LLATLPGVISSLKADHAAVDAVILKHEVPVDPAVIKGKRPYSARLCSSGQMTREILRALREVAPNALFTPEIAYKVARAAGVDVSNIGEAVLMDRVGRRLRRLASLKVITRHHPAVTTSHGAWSLRPMQMER